VGGTPTSTALGCGAEKRRLSAVEEREGEGDDCSSSGTSNVTECPPLTERCTLPVMPVSAVGGREGRAGERRRERERENEREREGEIEGGLNCLCQTHPARR
jgi:hypothetical protein